EGIAAHTRAHRRNPVAQRGRHRSRRCRGPRGLTGHQRVEARVLGLGPGRGHRRGRCRPGGDRGAPRGGRRRCRGPRGRERAGPRAPGCAGHLRGRSHRHRPAPRRRPRLPRGRRSRGRGGADRGARLLARSRSGL
ncbi:MAG: hypothetical protein AVDCRST_MAG69-701, partial [uncultured Solirubrobacteraceae bacterium]